MAPIKVGNDLNLGLRQILNAIMHPINGLPSTSAGEAGRLIFNTADQRLYVSSGAAWRLQATDADALQGISPAQLRDRSSHTGSQSASTISDLAAVVKAYKLHEFGAPTAAVTLGGQKITGLADGSAGSDAATYGQVLALINNQVFKGGVRVATTAAITLSGTQTVDGVALAANDRVLVKNQPAGATNGIYVAQAGAWVRATDADVASELPPGAIVPIAEGTTQQDQLFMLTTNGPITLGTTPLTFQSYGASSGEIGVAGAGLTKTGVTYDVGQGTGIQVGPDSIGVDTAVVTRKYTADVPAGSATPSFPHGLNNQRAHVQVTEKATGDYVLVPYTNTNANTSVLDFGSLAPVTDQYVVAIQG